MIIRTLAVATAGATLLMSGAALAQTSSTAATTPTARTQQEKNEAHRAAEYQMRAKELNRREAMANHQAREDSFNNNPQQEAKAQARADAIAARQANAAAASAAHPVVPRN